MFTLKFKQFVVAVFVALMPVLGGLQPAAAMGAPTGPSVPVIVATTSFSVDTSAMLDTAANMFNGLWPVFGVVVGIVLALGLITLLVTELRKAI